MVGDSNRSNWNKSGDLMNSDTACAAVSFTVATSCDHSHIIYMLSQGRGEGGEGGGGGGGRVWLEGCHSKAVVLSELSEFCHSDISSDVSSKSPLPFGLAGAVTLVCTWMYCHSGIPSTAVMIILLVDRRTGTAILRNNRHRSCCCRLCSF